MTTLPPGRLAVIADIHGNSDALRAVLADIDQQGVAAILNLGDHFSGPLDPAGTWKILRHRPAISIRGNHDRALIDRPPERMGDWDRPAFDALPPDALDWVRALPATLDLGTAFLCHATPGNDLTYWLETIRPDGSVHLRDAEGIEADAASVPAGLLLCGHTHLPRALRLSDGRLVVNPGSVGCPAYEDGSDPAHVVETGSPDARYALLDPGPGGWRVSHRAVPYDAGAMIRRAEAAGSRPFAQALAEGRVT
jgi:predicted phosphodiesterase